MARSGWSCGTDRDNLLPSDHNDSSLYHTLHQTRQPLKGPMKEDHLGGSYFNKSALKLNRKCQVQESNYSTTAPVSSLAFLLLLPPLFLALSPYSFLALPLLHFTPCSPLLLHLFFIFSLSCVKATPPHFFTFNCRLLYLLLI